MKNELIDILFKYNTDNSEDYPSENILLCLEEIRNYLELKGIHCEISIYDVAGSDGRQVRRGNLFSYNPKSRNPFLLMQGHIDTVPFSGEYSYCTEAGELVGRGSVDMKGSILSMIEAYEKMYHNEYINPPALLITGDEEANSFAGIRHFIENNNIPICFCINGEPSSFEINTAFKGVLIVEVLIKGGCLHSSDSNDVSIIEKHIDLFNDVKKFIETVRSVSDERLGRTIAAFTVVNAGNKSNQLPEQMRLSFNARIVRDSGVYLDIYNDILGKYLDKQEVCFDIMFFNPLEIDLEEKERNVLTRALNVSGFSFSETVMRAFTEASFLNQAGYRTIICGPGDLSLAHVDQKLERVDLGLLESYRDFLIEFVKEYNKK